MISLICLIPLFTSFYAVAAAAVVFVGGCGDGDGAGLWSGDPLLHD